MTQAYGASFHELHQVDHQALTVTGLPAFNDNYIWVLALANDPRHVTVVDPGDAAPVIDYCRRYGVVPVQIWLTHHHADHAGGVAELVAWSSEQGILPLIYGPAVEDIPGVMQPLRGGEQLSLGSVAVDVLSVPGHTSGHLAYFVGGTPEMVPVPPALFCGDVLFGLGCGRLFEGTAAQMFDSLRRIGELPSETRVYCAHEYTLLNLPFALTVDADNQELRARAEVIRRLRASGSPTVPLVLAEEQATNPFLRCNQPALVESAMVPTTARPVDVFARLRQMRDTFKAPQ